MGRKRKSPSEADKLEPKWKLVERVIALLEQTLRPDARVSHGEWLIDLTTGDKCQCDIIIRYGKPPRETLSIVEVQARTSRVKIGDLRNWHAKMFGVGGQHLLCVSALDFPQSVKNAVTKKLGPSVKLLRLKQLETKDWPFIVNFGELRLKQRNVEIIGKPFVGLNGPPIFTPQATFDPSDCILERDGEPDRLSLVSLANEYVNRQPQYARDADSPPGIYDDEVVFVAPDSRRLWLHLEGQRQQVVRVHLNIRVMIGYADLPVTFSAYEQVDYEGVLTWAAVATGTSLGREIQIRATFLPRDDGSFKVERIEQSGFETVNRLELAYRPPEGSA